MAPLLVHSLATFDDLFDRVFAAIGARRIAEIGAEGAQFTTFLANWTAEAEGGEVVCVDPVPSEALRDLVGARRHVSLIGGYSPAALADVGVCDAYVIDGDHNYATVHGETTELLARVVDSERPALLVYHDVAWPCARRDLYYDPERLPASDRHPYSYTGKLRPGDPGLAAYGFWGVGSFACAEQEGGERNGVLTAVEDAIADREDLALRIVPAIFGLGFLYATGASWAAALDGVLGPYDRDPLLDAMEQNRIDLYLQVLALQDQLAERSAAQARTVGRLSDKLAALEGVRIELARREELLALGPDD